MEYRIFLFLKVTSIQNVFLLSTHAQKKELLSVFLTYGKINLCLLKKESVNTVEKNSILNYISTCFSNNYILPMSDFLNLFFWITYQSEISTTHVKNIKGDESEEEIHEQTAQASTSKPTNKSTTEKNVTLENPDQDTDEEIEKIKKIEKIKQKETLEKNKQTKGDLISKCSFGVTKLTKKPMKILQGFLP